MGMQLSSYQPPFYLTGRHSIVCFNNLYCNCDNYWKRHYPYKKPLNILVSRNIHTRFYLKSSVGWTSNPSMVTLLHLCMVFIFLYFFSSTLTAPVIKLGGALGEEVYSGTTLSVFALCKTFVFRNCLTKILPLQFMLKTFLFESCVRICAF